MSFVITTRSYFSRNSLQSISTRVVLPDPTGPPMPTPSVVFRLVHLGLLMGFPVLGAKQARILVRMPRRNDSEVGGKGGDLVRPGLDRSGDHVRDEGVRCKNYSLSCDLTERDRLESCSYLIFDPTK